MALSNILRESRRELIETAIGAAIVLPLLYVDYRFASWAEEATLTHYSWGDHSSIPFPIGLLVGAGLIFLGILSLVGIHKLGEVFADWLEDNNIRIRPRRQGRNR